MFFQQVASETVIKDKKATNSERCKTHTTPVKFAFYYTLQGKI